jgi:predicted lipid-binding transport protein (Tim44 family)
MRLNLPQVVAPVVLLVADSVAWGQAFRPIPVPRVPVPRVPGGGGSFVPHFPIPGLENTDFGMYCAILVGVIILAIGGWLVGLLLGRLWRGVPFQPNVLTAPSMQFKSAHDATGGTPHFHFEAPPVPPMQDLILSPDEVMDKSLRATRLMQFLARTDSLFDPGSLRDWVRDLFCRVQQCWQARDPGPVKEHLTSKALAHYEDLIRTMRARHLINRVDDLHVRRLELVHVARPEETDRHEFTALITFEARAHFVHERTGVPLYGPPKTTWYQEFWTFRRDGDAWRLDEVQESWNDRPMTAPNTASGLSEAELRNVELWT